MVRLIDATRIEQYILNNCSDNEEINAIYAAIVNAPTVDAVEVVHCKDCKFYDKQTFMGHSMGWASCSGRFADVDDNGLRFKIPSEDWFCADGEKEG